MLSDIGQPQFVHRRGGELSLHEIVMDRGSGPLPRPSWLLLPERTPPALCGSDPPRRPVTHYLARVTGFIGKEPIPELGVITVRVKECVRSIRFDKFPLTDRLLQPAIVGLT